MLFLTLWLIGLMIFYANPMNRINDPLCVYNPFHPINSKMRSERQIRKELVAKWKGIPHLELENIVREANGRKNLSEMSMVELDNYEQQLSDGVNRGCPERAYGTFWVGGGIRLWHINAIQKTLFATMISMAVLWLILSVI